jgi:hypothetical protein
LGNPWNIDFSHKMASTAQAMCLFINEKKHVFKLIVPLFWRRIGAN